MIGELQKKQKQKLEESSVKASTVARASNPADNRRESARRVAWDESFEDLSSLCIWSTELAAIAKSPPVNLLDYAGFNAIRDSSLQP
jgi:hypothetical protein